MTLLHVIHTGNGRSSMTRFMLKTVFNSLFLFLLGTNGTGPRKVTGVSRLLNQIATSLRCFPLINTTWPHSHRLMLEAILRSSDASAFSTEDLTRLQAGICQQLADRTRQPARTSRGADQPESTGVADPYLPASRPNSAVTTGDPTEGHDLR